MLLPDKYTRVEDSMIFIIESLLQEVGNSKYKIEELYIISHEKLSLSYTEFEMALILGYAMEILNINDRGQIYVEHTEN